MYVLIDRKAIQSVKKIKTEIKTEVESEDEDKNFMNPMAIDNEPEEERDIKPTILENGVAVPPPELKAKPAKKLIPPPDGDTNQATVQQIIDKNGFIMLRVRSIIF